MSVTPDEKEFVELPHLGDAAFGALLDALVPAEAGATGAGEAVPAAPGATAADAGDSGAAGSPGQPAAAGEAGAGTPAVQGDGATGGSPAPDGQPAAGAADGSPEQSATDGAGSDLPATWTTEPAVAIVELGTLSKALEENVGKAFQQQSYESVREEHGAYFDALEKHPRLLVGTSVPAIGKEGNETLRSTEDAREWQEAVKSLLVAEIRERATQKMEESADYLETVHASIDLFKNNKDLIPGTKGFDRRLADAFAEMATPYEVRVDGKLQGYSIPVQPIIDNLRKQLKAAAPAPSPAAAPPAVAPPARPAPEPPQAGIPSKAGSSGEREDFSTLFGTIGLPNLQI